MQARGLRRLSWLAVLLAPVACADLLGLEPGVLNVAGGGAGVSGVAGAKLVEAGTPGSGGSNAPAGGNSVGSAGSASAGTPGADADGAGGAGGAGGGAPPDVADGGEPSTGPCKNGTCTECPEGMRRVYSNEAYFYCIDVGEVTNEDYLAFSERYTPASVIASSACANNTSLVPDTECSSALTDVPSRKLPVVCVDYCDAEAYCTMKGKRLCGRVGGTMNDPGDNVNAAASEWFAACTGPSMTVYPYGDAASANKCNSSGYAPADMGPRDLATLSECQGGFAGLYNMSGNVAEWEWSCSSSAANAPCSTRGGSFKDGPYEVRCSGSISRSRREASEEVGFRCCANLKN